MQQPSRTQPTPQKKRAAAFRLPPATGWALVKLLDVGVDRQVGREPGDEAATAPIGTETTRIDWGDAGRAGRRVVAGEGVAVALAEVGVDVAQIDCENLPGPT